MSRMDQGNAAEQLKDSAAEVTQNIRNIGSQARDAAGEKLNELRHQANEYYDQGRQQAQEWERTLEQYVQEKPIQSLLIAAGVGLVIGALWRKS